MHFTIDGQLPVVACIISWILGIITLPLCLNIFKVLVKVLFQLKPTKVHNKKKLLQQEDSGEEDAYKLVLCVRNDLAMGKGKIAAQCSHAAIGTYIDGIKNNCSYLSEWLNNGQRKVVVKIKDYEEMKLLYKEAKRRNINTHLTCDAGKTQVPSGSYTVIAIGPAPDKILNNITGHLKLL